MTCGKCGNDCILLGHSNRLVKESTEVTPEERIAVKLDRLMQLVGHFQELLRQYPGKFSKLRKGRPIIDAADVRRQAQVKRALAVGQIARDPTLLDSLTYEDIDNL